MKSCVSGQRFRGQGTTIVGEPGCSSFLIAPNQIATAAHCVRFGLTNEPIPPSDMRIVFGYRVGARAAVVDTVPLSDVYTATAVTEGAWDTAVITLDRAVPANDRTFVLAPNKTNANALANTRLASSGYPAGLPVKIADGGYFLLDQGPVMRIGGIDIAGGNSGSAVFSIYTGDVIGVISAGPTSYDFDQANHCAYEVVDNNGNTVVSKIDHVSALASGRTYGSCAGFCGDTSVDGCWCDADCDRYGDCCEDKGSACTSQIMASPCVGRCGSSSSEAVCDFEAKCTATAARTFSTCAVT